MQEIFFDDRRKNSVWHHDRELYEYDIHPSLRYSDQSETRKISEFCCLLIGRLRSNEKILRSKEKFRLARQAVRLEVLWCLGVNVYMLEMKQTSKASKQINSGPLTADEVDEVEVC